MPRLIDADALVADRSIQIVIGAGDNICVDIADIKNAPTIEAEPVRHGRWEEIEDFDGDSHWRCSACGCEWWFEVQGPSENGSNYCPNCGAKMDGDSHA